MFFVGNVHSSDADDELDDSTLSMTSLEHEQQNDSPARGRSTHYSPSNHRTTASGVSKRSSPISVLRATAAEFIPARQKILGNKIVEMDEAQHDRTDLSTPDAFYYPPLAGLPDLYSLDGYGIPWFYHMYPVPWSFAPFLAKGRSRSPKKFRPKKQRSILEQNERFPREGADLEALGVGAARTGIPARPEYSVQDAVDLTRSVADSSDNTLLQEKTNSVRSADNPFATQLDEVTRQAALQPSTNIARAAQADLTSVRNVPLQDAQGHSISPNRHRRHLQARNGLYGGRGNVGVPLYATAPFPDPVPPMGRPSEGYAGYTLGTKACGTVYIEKAAEQVGGRACHACQPDHATL